LSKTLYSNLCTYLVGEIETELIGGDERSFLVSILAQDFSESVVEHVRAGVVVHDVPPPRAVQVQLQRVADTDSPFNCANVNDVTTEYLDVLHRELSALEVNNTLVLSRGSSFPDELHQTLEIYKVAFPTACVPRLPKISLHNED